MFLYLIALFLYTVLMKVLSITIINCWKRPGQGYKGGSLLVKSSTTSGTQGGEHTPPRRYIEKDSKLQCNNNLHSLRTDKPLEQQLTDWTKYCIIKTKGCIHISQVKLYFL